MNLTSFDLDQAAESPRRILILANMSIYPADVGNKARIWTLLQQLRQAGHDVWFGGLGLNEQEAAVMREALGDRFLCAPFRTLWQSETIAGAIYKGLAIRLAGRGWIVPDLDLWYRDEWDGAIQQWQRQFRFDTVLVEYVFFSRALLNFGPDVLKLIDTHDVFADRYKKLRASGIRRFWFVTDKEQERKGLERADTVIAIQDHEAEYFRREIERPVVTIGHSVRLEPLPEVRDPVVGYFGSGNAANVQALESFLSEVWPLVRQAVPEAKLLVGGGIARRYSSREDLLLMPVVDDPAEVYSRAMVMVNPMQVGTGLKIKSIEALGFGRPLVTTTVGAHGLEAAADSAFLLANRPAEMARALASVLREPATRAALSAAAFQFVQDWNENLDRSLASLLTAEEPCNVA
jgi:glycosyltransferase involved in cell wall biosynthesis